MNSTSPLTSSLGRAAAAASPTRRVVDAPTRAFHWLFALCFVGAYATSDGERLRMLHVTLGYTMAGLLTFRVLYGLFGPRHARRSLMWRKLSSLGPWLRSWRPGPSTGAVNWRQGQNLLMALAVVALLALVVPLTLSGYATFNEWGGEWLEELHEAVGQAFLLVVLLHLAAIAGMSVLRRKNQALPMLTGRVPGAGPDLVRHDHAWLAGVLVLAVAAFWSWEWQHSPNGLLSATTLNSPRGADDD